jgi:multidrug efflux pump subunit AcrB
VRYILAADQEKAALNGIQVVQINQALETALKGKAAGLMHVPEEKEDVQIFFRSPLAARAGIQRLGSIKIPGSDGHLVPLSEPGDAAQNQYRPEHLPQESAAGSLRHRGCGR